MFAVTSTRTSVWGEDPQFHILWNVLSCQHCLVDQLPHVCCPQTAAHVALFYQNDLVIVLGHGHQSWLEYSVKFSPVKAVSGLLISCWTSTMPSTSAVLQRGCESVVVTSVSSESCCTEVVTAWVWLCHTFQYRSWINLSVHDIVPYRSKTVFLVSISVSVWLPQHHQPIEQILVHKLCLYRARQKK